MDRVAKDLDEPSRKLSQDGKDYETVIRRIDLAMDGILEVLEMPGGHENSLVLKNSLEDLNEKTAEAFSQMDELRFALHQASQLSKDLRTPCMRIDEAIASILASRKFFVGWEARAKQFGGD